MSESPYRLADKLRICVLAPLYFTDHSLNFLTQRLVERGASAVVIARRSPRNSERREAYGSVQVVRVPPCTSGRMGTYAMMIPAFLELVRLRRHYDIICVSRFSILGLVGIAAGRVLRKRCVLKAENDDEMSGQIFYYLNEWGLCHTTLFKWVFSVSLAVRKWLLRKADCFVAVSKQIEAEFQNSGVPKEKIRYIPMGIDTDRFYPASEEQTNELRKRLSLPTGKVIINYSGRLVRGKGVEFLLHAWEEISHLHPQVHLLIVGSGQNWFAGYEHTLKAFVQSQGLTESTTFTGYVENRDALYSIVNFMRASDIYVLPSEKDALPTTVIEAMACGLPVVASGVGGIVDLVTPGETGLLIEPRRPDQIADALQSLITDHDLRRAMGQQGYQRIVSHFSIDKVVSDYIDAFTGGLAAARR